MDFLKFSCTPALSKKHVQSCGNLGSLNKTYGEPSCEDGVEMDTGGSHDLTENYLFDLQEVSVQMIMFRLEALMR